MEKDEAIKLIGSIEAAMSEAMSALLWKDRMSKVFDEYINKKKELNTAISKLNDEMKGIKMLLNTYQRLHPDEVTICPQCGGEGGWSYCDDYGNGDGGVCDCCEGAGVVIKKGE